MRHRRGGFLQIGMGIRSFPLLRSKLILSLLYEGYSQLLGDLQIHYKAFAGSFTTLKWPLWLFLKRMYVVANIIENFKNDSILKKILSQFFIIALNVEDNSMG